MRAIGVAPRIWAVVLLVLALGSSFLVRPQLPRGRRTVPLRDSLWAEPGATAQWPVESSSSSSSSSSREVPRELYDHFYTLLQHVPGSAGTASDAAFNPEISYRLHSQLLFSLIGSDVQNLDAEEGATQMTQQQLTEEDTKPFPASYLEALAFIKKLLKQMQGADGASGLAELYSAAKFVPRKEGIHAIRTDVAATGSMTVRQIVEAKRKIERSLSLLLVLIIAHKKCLATATSPPPVPSSGQQQQAPALDTPTPTPTPTPAPASTASTAASDLVFFAKILLERLSPHERHFALLVLCRGILSAPILPSSLPLHHDFLPPSAAAADDGLFFSPKTSRAASTSASTGSSSEADSDSARLLAAVAHPPLGAAFSAAMRAAGLPQPSAAVRVLFPFAASSLRYFHDFRRRRQALQARGQLASSGDGEGQGLFADDGGGNARGSDVDGYRDGEQEHQGADEHETCEPFETYEGPDSAYTPTDLRIARMAAACGQLDRQSMIAKSLTRAADEALVTLRRSLVDMCAGHFIAQAQDATPTSTPTPTSTSTPTTALTQEPNAVPQALPEHLRRNTVAMELIHTNKALTPGGSRKHRRAWEAAWADIGSHVDAVCSLFDDADETQSAPMASTASTASTTVSGLRGLQREPSGLVAQGGQGEHGGAVEGTAEAVTRMKKYLACIGLLRYFPVTARGQHLASVSKLLGQGGGGGGRTSGSRGGGGGGLGSPPPPPRSDDDLFQTSRGRGSRRVRGQQQQDAVTAADEDLFGEPNLRRGGGSPPYSTSTPNSNSNANPNPARRPAAPRDAGVQRSLEKSLEEAGLPPRTLLAGADKALAVLVAHALELPPSALLDSPAASLELDYIFSTWRRPGLLLDYLCIHSSSPLVQALFRRFLRALLSLSTETVDDIRYKDAGNRMHLSRLPAGLAAAWIEGKAPSGAILPGYNDPQTLFMVGEDSGTCMMVRPRQKGTNRGLLSFLLHGNVRVLGRQDSSGRLQERCVVVLAIDDATNRAVLWVETPFGEGNMEEVYDQCAELGELLGLAVIYSAAPNANVYVMGDRELEAVGGKRKYVNAGAGGGAGGRAGGSIIKGAGAAAWGEESWDGAEESGPERDNLYEVTGAWEQWGGEGGDDEPTLTLEPASPVPPERLINISDYTMLAPWVWVDGVWDPCRNGRFYPGRCPLLSRRGPGPSIGIGVRTSGTLEPLDYSWPLCTNGSAMDDASAPPPSPEEVAYKASLLRLAAGGPAAGLMRAPPRPRLSSGSSTGPSPLAPNRHLVGSYGAAHAARDVNAQSHTAKLIERNRALAQRTQRVFRPPPARGPEDSNSNSNSNPDPNPSRNMARSSEGSAGGEVADAARVAPGERRQVSERGAGTRQRRASAARGDRSTSFLHEEREKEKEKEEENRRETAVKIRQQQLNLESSRGEGRFAGEKEPAVMPIFEDDADDLFG